MQKLQEISQAFNRPQLTHREPSQERPQNQEDALGAKLYAWKKKATQVPQGDEYEHHYAEDPYEVSEGHTVKIGDGEDDVKVPGSVLIGYWRDNTWRWPNLARLALDALSMQCQRNASDASPRGRRRYHHSEWPSASSLSRRRSVTTSGFARISTETAPARSTGLLHSSYDAASMRRCTTAIASRPP